jgi:carbon storage regulator
MMLVIQRDLDERLFLTTANGQKIVVTVTEIAGRKVKLGIDADKSVKVWREEVRKQTDTEAAEARSVTAARLP